jgi:predicted ATPase
MQTTDPFVGCLSWAAITLWFLGYPHQARQRSQEAFAVLQTLSHPYSLAFALFYAIVVHQCCGEVSAVQERTEALITLAQQHGFPFWVALGRIWQGWVLVEQGQVQEGIAQISQNLDNYQATGAKVGRPFFLILLAKGYRKAEQMDKGLTVLDEALVVAHTTGECRWEAELYRLKGEFLLAQKTEDKERRLGDSRLQIVGVRYASSLQTEAEACFQQALIVARRQQAKSLELRAAMSLNRLWQQQERHHEAHQLLSEVYGWFTEGFDTKDLQEARRLLQALGSGTRRVGK